MQAAICADGGFNIDPLNFDSFGAGVITVLVCMCGEGKKATTFLFLVNAMSE